jgi:hypothetical protein
MEIVGIPFVLEFDPPHVGFLNPPIKIKVKYTDDDVVGINENFIMLYRAQILSETFNRWQPILGGYTRDPENNTVEVIVNRLSTFAAMGGGAPFGDLNGDDGDDRIDALDVLTLMQHIVGKTSIFNNLDPEFAKYVADVSRGPDEDPSDPDAIDVLTIMQYIVGKISEFPVGPVQPGPSLIASHLLASGDSTLFLKRSSFGNSGTVSVILDSAEDILSAEIGLVYDAEVLKFTGATQTSLAPYQVMEYNTANTGELQIALVGVESLNSENTVLDIQFEMAEGAGEVELDSVKLTKVKLNNGLVKAKLEAFPQKLTLLQNYPNPFNPETWIPYKLNQNSDVEVRIYNVNGQLVQTLYMGKQSPGNYVTKEKAAYWDGRNRTGEKVTSGVYFYQLLARNNSIVRKMVILK